MSRDGSLRSLFQINLPQCHWQAIESPFVSRGIPDMNGCCNGHEFWVENKKTSGWTVDLRPEQVAWHLRRARAGGRTFIAVRRQSKRKTMVDDLYLIHGDCADKAKRDGLKGLGLGDAYVWAGGPKHWAWDEVLNALLLGS